MFIIYIVYLFIDCCLYISLLPTEKGEHVARKMSWELQVAAQALAVPSQPCDESEGHEKTNLSKSLTICVFRLCTIYLLCVYDWLWVHLVFRLDNCDV